MWAKDERASNHSKVRKTNSDLVTVTTGEAKNRKQFKSCFLIQSSHTSSRETFHETQTLPDLIKFSFYFQRGETLVFDLITVQNSYI